MAKRKRQIIGEFDPASHIGKVGDVVWPSVTQLITEFKLVDYSMVHPDRLEYKRVLGTAVDMACDLWERDNLDIPSLHQEILPYFNAYRKFTEIEGFAVDLEKSMKRYWSAKWRYHGQPDLVCSKDGENVLIDRKCTWVLYPSGDCQTAAYKALIEENERGFKIHRRFLLKLNNNGNYELREAKNYTQDLQDFYACLRLHWRRRDYYHTTKGVADNE
jgi:hypothetical protein